MGVYAFGYRQRSIGEVIVIVKTQSAVSVSAPLPMSPAAFVEFPPPPCFHTMLAAPERLYTSPLALAVATAYVLSSRKIHSSAVGH